MSKISAAKRTLLIFLLVLAMALGMTPGAVAAEEPFPEEEIAVPEELPPMEPEAPVPEAPAPVAPAPVVPEEPEQPAPAVPEESA